MSTANRALRIISRQGLTLAAVLVLVGVVAAAGAVWVYATPPSETVTEQTAVQTVGVDVRTSGVVTGNTSLYEPGERLVDMPVYFQGFTPVLTLTVLTDTPEGVRTRVTQRLTLEQRATRNGEVFFATNRSFMARTDEVTSGSLTASTDVNVTDLREEIAAPRREIGAVGSYQATLRLTVDYRTDRYQGTIRSETPVVFTSGAYWLDRSLGGSQEHSTPVTRVVTRPPDAGTYGFLLVLSLLSFGAAAAVEYTRRTVDVETISVAFSHEEYEEWISHGEFPTGTDKRYISINGLEDLVDIAIDSNKRVIFDDSLDVYSVIDGDLVYYFSRDPFNIDVWLDT